MTESKMVIAFVKLIAATSLLSVASSVIAAQQPVAYPADVNADFLQGLRWRSIGPPRGGRVPAVAGDPKNPLVFYMGTEGGGVWKTYDAGRYWQNVSDPYFKTASIGAMAVAPSNPNVIYVGTGETSQHVDIQAGDGVYKSTDGGATWVNVGLGATRHIAKIVVSPRDPIWCTWRHSATSSRPIPTAVCIGRRMAAGHGRKSCMSATVPAPWTSRWIDRTPK